MIKNLIFQLFKTKTLAKIEKLFSARKGVKSAHWVKNLIFQLLMTNEMAKIEKLFGDAIGSNLHILLIKSKIICVV